MKRLRQIIRQLILESEAKDYYNEVWFNTEEERPQREWDKLRSMVGTFHKDKLKQNKLDNHANHLSDEDIDTLFDGKRDAKRLWNDTIDKFNLRDFWENNEDIVYFHSLRYYGEGSNGTKGKQIDGLQVDMVDEPVNLSVRAFLKKYKIKNNKDEMSTFGVYQGQTNASDREKEEGFLLKGRVTLATRYDAWVESRSKGSPSDMNRHKSSGMPKRSVPNSENIDRLLFDASDIEEGGLGECILDNWSIVGYVSPDWDDEVAEDEMLKWCEENGIEVYNEAEVFHWSQGIND